MTRWSRLGAITAGLLIAGLVRGDDWPQWLGPQRDGVWRETGIIKQFPKGGPKVRWRTPIRAGYSGPAVAEGCVYITDRVLAPSAKNPANPFRRGNVPGSERILCLDEKTGKILWRHEYDCVYDVSYPLGPRTTPLVADGKVYTLGTMGDLFCLEARTGKVIWSKNFPKEYGAEVPLWGFAAHPLLDGKRLICLVGGKGSLVVAFDKDTGKEVWKALSAPQQGYCPPMIYQVGATRQLIIWEPTSVNGLNPETGEPYWRVPFVVRAALTIPTPRLHDDLLFVTSFYNGSLMLKLDKKEPKADVLWRGKGRNERQTADLHAIMATPFFVGDYIYGICSYGQLRCIKAANGDRVWSSLEATGGKTLRWGKRVSRAK
ncbi:MAG: hypothetical protein KatS3mg105_4021 [Gemmatales bacterium]|nr:MAG: hypothetical protein KatS3mg105_4021 [Gemmatales bacterium]